jgi:diguanylate cyclase (GGDEF)-like protein
LRVRAVVQRLTLKRRLWTADNARGVRSSRELGAITAQLAAARARIAELEGELTRSAGRDLLAESLLSLRAFRTQLDVDVQRAQRYERPLTLAMLDIDRFRYANLKHGYGAGDLILGAVGRVISQRTRAHDLGCRTGGDEFAILFPETPPEEATEAVERILVELEDVEAGGVRGISASAGVASLVSGQTAEALLARAREALEVARGQGGGRASVLSGEGALGSGTETELLQSHGAVAALASALTERDRYTGDHSESVVDLTARVGEALALDATEIDQIRMAALLHDIGKVGVPDAILNKTGPLDDSEWEIMRQHPVIGERILRAIPGMGSIARIVRHEHERWDGTGYPDGLMGVAIPVGARIILACDAYHAMTSDRPYRMAMPHSDAISELSANAGSQFDPHVVEALVGYLYGRRQSGLTAV